jgi:two-component system, NarL family, response regulator DevR
MNSGLLTAVVSAVTGVIVVVLTAWLVWLQIIDRRRAAKPPDPASGSSTRGADDASRSSGPTKAPLRVMVVEDHEFVRESICRLLSGHGIAVIAEEGSVRAAIGAADRFQPDVIVMDIQLPDGSGIEATREILNKNPRIRVLMLTASEEQEALISSIMAGASGYVRKRVGNDELIAAVRAVGEGRKLIDPDMIGALLERVRAGQNAVADPHSPSSADAAASGERHTRLSEQENRVLSLIAKGLTDRRITAELGLNEATVRNYVSSILGKLGVGHRSDPAAYPDRGGMGHGV